MEGAGMKGDSMSSSGYWERYKKVRLPIERDGQTIWKTVKAESLAGMTDSRGVAGMCWSSPYVFRTESGKLVVYEGKTKRIDVYDSFDAMKANVPEDVYLQAARKAGTIPEETFPEEPLEV